MGWNGQRAPRFGDRGGRLRNIVRNTFAHKTAVDATCQDPTRMCGPCSGVLQDLREISLNASFEVEPTPLLRTKPL